MTGPLEIPTDTARVTVRATWRGAVHECEKAILPEAATVYAVDKAIWDATVQVRRTVIKQAYPNVSLTDSRVQFRNEFEAMGAIRNYLAVNTDRFFALEPPRQGVDQWRAYFSSRYPIGELKPPVGVGSTEYVAIENLLRFTEGREPIDD
jgi:hypothetical protein